MGICRADLHVVLDSEGNRGKPYLDRQVGIVLASVKDGCSLAEGCQAASLSYTNAWNRVRDLERGIGKALMVKSRGRLAIITPEGEAIARIYQEIQERAAEEVRERLAPLLA